MFPFYAENIFRKNISSFSSYSSSLDNFNFFFEKAALVRKSDSQELKI